ncbi:MBG domain-containing protein, partial [Arthrospira platensis SPKY1]|nr:MBG domain-containing protein [Arthrospira platensis SPKY1]
YAITFTDGTLTITPRALSIRALDATKVYGDVLSFAGTEFVADGLVNSDVVEEVTLASLGSDATSEVNTDGYVITASDAAGSGLSNYAITFTDGTLTITPR